MGGRRVASVAVHDVYREQIVGARVDAMLAFPMVLQKAFSQWKVGMVTIGDADVQVLRDQPRTASLNLYFDEAGLLGAVGAVEQHAGRDRAYAD